jgi:hypothetical protein
MSLAGKIQSIVDRAFTDGLISGYRTTVDATILPNVPGEYNPATGTRGSSGAPIVLKAIFNSSVRRELITQDGPVQAGDVSFLVRESDLSAEPTTHWQVVYGSRTYRVVHSEPIVSDGGVLMRDLIGRAQ